MSKTFSHSKALRNKLSGFLMILIANLCFTQQGFSQIDCNQSQVNNTCTGTMSGVAATDPTGGDGNYTFEWSHSETTITSIASGLEAGDYSVTISDASGASTVCDFTITQAPFIVIDDILETNPLCGINDGILEIFATPKDDNPLSQNLSYSIDGGLTFQDNGLFENLPGGDYLVIVLDGEGCYSTESPQLVGTPPLVVDVVAMCAPNGNIDLELMATGGTPFYTYEWEGPNGATYNVEDLYDVPYGIYSVTVTDRVDCQTVAVSTELDCCNEMLICNATIIDAECFGLNNGSINIDPLGGTGPFVYNWSHDANLDDDFAADLATGLYIITVTDALGCQAVCMHNVGTMGGSLIDNVTVTNDMCEQGLGTISIDATAVPDDCEVLYSINDGEDLTLESFFDEVPSGRIKIRIEDCNGCIDTLSVDVEGETAPNIFSVNTMCIMGTNVTIEIGVSMGTPPYSYSWVGDEGFTSDMMNIVMAPNENYTLVVTDANGCTDEATIDALDGCGDCEAPILTAGDVTCFGDFYSVKFYSSSSDVTSNAGNVNLITNTISEIPVGTDVIITSSTNIECSTITTISSPEDCSGNGCNTPVLIVGQANCSGNDTYEVTFAAENGATISSNGGEVSGNSVINIPVDLDIIVTATKGDCSNSATISSPEDCNDPCSDPEVTIGGPICSANGTYSINYSVEDGSSVTNDFDNSTNGGTVSGIPVGTDITFTMTKEGCGTRVVTITSPDSCPCQAPVLTVGGVICDGETYSVLYFSSSENITTNAGVININAGTITDIPVGTNATIEAAYNFYCSSNITVISPSSCDEDCDVPIVITGQPACTSEGFYNLTFAIEAGAVLTSTAGDVNGNSVENIPSNTNVILTATKGDCNSQLEIDAPEDCSDPCAGPGISLGGPICGLNGTYSLNYSIVEGTIVSNDYNSVTEGGTITGIPVGTNITFTATIPGCETQTFTVISPVSCPCEVPILTSGAIECNGNEYSVSFFSSTNDVSSNIGTITNNMVTGIPVGSDVIITASSQEDCNSIITITSPDSCEDDGCDNPTLLVGQGICFGSGTYVVDYTVEMGAVITANIGTITANAITDIPVGTNIVITATENGCESTIEIESPTDCEDPCEDPGLSVSGPLCQAGGFYSISYTIVPGTMVSNDFNNSTVGGTISDIPLGTDITFTSTIEGCSTKTITISSPTNCPTACIGDMVWEDNNGDGIMDDSEPGLEGMRIELYAANGTLLATTYSDADGKYSFCDLEAGNYYLNFFPINLTASPSNQGGDETRDSDVDGSNGVGTTQIINLSPGEKDYSWDAGFYACIPLGKCIWFDTDEDSKKDADEKGINNVKVDIYKSNPDGTYSLYATTVTETNENTGAFGFWEVCVPPGTYYVKIPDIVYGLVLVLPSVGDDTEDSDFTGAFGPGTTDEFTVEAGDVKCDISAGFIPEATLGDRVWFDENVDGMRNPGESGVEGVGVRVFNQAGQLVAETQTDDEGTYLVENLGMQLHHIEFVPPAGYGFTLPDVGDDENSSDVDHSNGPNTTSKFATICGKHTGNIDAGLVFTVLPAVWSGFAGENKGNYNDLKWNVLDESNVDAYTIERAVNNQLFTAIGTQSFDLTNDGAYSFIDNDIAAPNVYYYRIKLQDLNGVSSYSSIISIQVNETTNTSSKFEIYPNPVSDVLSVSLNVTSQIEEISYDMITITGQSVKELISVNTESFAEGNLLFDVSTLSEGIYIIRINIGDEKFQKKIIKTSK